MAETLRVLALTIETLQREPGLWCETCLLPSAWRLVLAVGLEERMHMQTWVCCPECGGAERVHGQGQVPDA